MVDGKNINTIIRFSGMAFAIVVVVAAVAVSGISEMTLSLGCMQGFSKEIY